MRRFAPLLIVTGALLLAARPAAAQHITSPYRFLTNIQEISAYAGHFFSTAGTAGVGAHSAPLYAARYDIRVSGPFNFEGGISLVSTTRAVVDTAANAQDTLFLRPVGQSQLTLALIDAGVRFDITGPRTFHNILPYLEMGVAAIIRTRDQNSLEQNIDPALQYRPGTRFGGMVGAGLEWIPTRHIGLRLDARNYLWRIKAPLGILTLSSTTPASEWLNHYSLTGGIVVRF